MTSLNHKSKITNPKSKPQTGSASSGFKTMGELLASQKTLVVAPRKGEIIPGTITKLTPAEILVNLGSKAEAVVLEKDKKILRAILSTLKVGDKVSVQVLNPESEMGYPVVSLRRFLDNKMWERISKLKEDKEVLDVLVNEAVRGGFLVSTSEGISGFLPNSQVSFASSPQKSDDTEGEYAQNLTGNDIKAIILEVDRSTRKIIFSQTQTMREDDFDALIKKFKIGQKVEALIKNITPYGIFVSVPFEDDKAIDGFIHISEISWGKISRIPSTYKPSETIDAYVLDFDKESRRLNLSIKMLQPDPFKEKAKDFPIDKKVKAKVLNVSPSGVLLDLGDGLEGFVRKEKIPPAVSYQTEDVIDALVSEIDEKRRRIVLVPVLKEKPIGYR